MKKNKIFLILIYIIFFTTTSTSIYPQKRTTDGYYLGTIGNGVFTEQGVIYYYDNNSPHWTNYNDLKFNNNHQYLPSGLNWDYDQGVPKKIGSFKDAINNYFPHVYNIINRSYNSGTGQFLLLERMRTNFAAYGQRSTYQVEDNASMITKRPGYGYKYSDVGSDINDPLFPEV